MAGVPRPSRMRCGLAVILLAVGVGCGARPRAPVVPRADVRGAEARVVAVGAPGLDVLAFVPPFGLDAGVRVRTATRLVRAAIDEPARRSAAVTAPAPFTGALGRGEYAFLDTYTAGGPLVLAIADVARGRMRYESVVVGERLRSGSDTIDSYVQLQVHHAADRIELAGQFVGQLRLASGAKVASEIRQVDACEARRRIECFGIDGKTVAVMPLAGVIGEVAFVRR